jgi:hypothetical protein
MVEKKHSRVDDLLNFKLPNGKRLGDAKEVDLNEAIAYYKAKEAEAEANLKKIKQYLDSILAKP